MHLKKWLNNKGDTMVITEIINAVKAGQLDEKLTALYGADALASQKVRYEEVLSKAKDLLGDKEAHIFSTPRVVRVPNSGKPSAPVSFL